MIPRRSLVAFLMLGALAACEPAPATSTGPSAGGDLAGSWRVMSIAGVKVDDINATRMTFADGTLSGTFGCNEFSGPYSMEGGLLRVGATATTRMACGGSGGRQERSGLRQLGFPMQVVPHGAQQIVLSGKEGQSFILER